MIAGKLSTTLSTMRPSHIEGHKPNSYETHKTYGNLHIYTAKKLEFAMDLDNNEQEVPAKRRGRPRKGVICGRGRPAKGDGPSYYQARGLRAPKTKAAPQPATTMVTRSRGGKLDRKGYRLRQRWAHRRGDGEGDGNDEEDDEEGGSDEPMPNIDQFPNNEGGDEEDDEEDDGDEAMCDVDQPLDDPFGDELVLDDDPFGDELMRDAEPPVDDELSSDGDESAVKIKSEPGPRSWPPLQPGRHGDGGAIAISSDSDSYSDSDDEVSADGEDLGSLADSTTRPRSIQATGSTPAASSRRQDAARPMPRAEDAFMVRQRDIRQLFPIPHSYLVGLRGSYWDADVEEAFRELWARDDHGDRLAQGRRATSDEVQLWKIMLAHFYRIPPHLFTYGLKLGEDCYEAPESLMLTSKASRALQRICVHPVWNGELDPLRYTLQMAALASAREHSEPFGPLPNSMASIVEDSMLARLTGTARDRAAGEIQYNMWTRGKAGYIDRSVGTLIGMLDGRIRPNRHAGQAEKSLFILTTGVMEDLLGVLDQFERHKFSLTADEQVAEFRRFWAGELELCELRDAEIREAMRRLAHEDDFLYDVPHIGTSHCDRAPLYEHHVAMDKRAVLVLRGEVTDPKRTLLDELDRLDGGRESALDKFTARLAGAPPRRRRPPTAETRGRRPRRRDRSGSAPSERAQEESSWKTTTNPASRARPREA
ncbi:hypothetical protein EKO27_g11415 [Xylaria grammica]|uniref:Uncharacterized protein n=1 Tax=Xylaria grammica TaxID=363999 RepID=A0A439CNF4_9PEZI|nr:hypothetical protein EKO27_g11415 [Xylaria grammica]